MTMQECTLSQPEPMSNSARVKLGNAGGLHGREAAMLVKLARSMEAELVLACNGRQADANSIMGLLSLDMAEGMDILATASGPDAESMIHEVEALFASGFQPAAGQNPRSFFRRMFTHHFELTS